MKPTTPTKAAAPAPIPDRTAAVAHAVHDIVTANAAAAAAARRQQEQAVEEALAIPLATIARVKRSLGDYQASAGFAELAAIARDLAGQTETARATLASRHAEQAVGDVLKTCTATLAMLDAAERLYAGRAAHADLGTLAAEIRRVASAVAGLEADPIAARHARATAKVDEFLGLLKAGG